MKRKILFCIGSLRSGGKERRFLELLKYLSEIKEYEIKVIFTSSEIHYSYFFNLNIPFKILERKWVKKDPRLFILFFKEIMAFEPDIIHTWGNMTTLYAIPSSILLRIPIIDSQITNATTFDRRSIFERVTTNLNFYFSKKITSNSKAGLKCLDLEEDDKFKVIYNGINLDRFENLLPNKKVREKYSIDKQYVITMVASFSLRKDFERFLKVSLEIEKRRSDVKFIAVGDGEMFHQICEFSKKLNLSNILFTGKISDVENILAVTDIGVLFTNSKVHGEGISNSILEYMAMRKPVIANDSGGTSEIVNQGITGYVINNESPIEIASLILNLIDDSEKRKKMGQAGYEKVVAGFTLNKMGGNFHELYNDLLQNKIL